MWFGNHKTDLGDPALKIAGLQIWIHGREYADAAAPHDADWLRITAHCGDAGSSVWVQGAFLSSWSFAQFRSECVELQQTLRGSALLGSYEPNLRAEFRAVGHAGHLEFQVDITPNSQQQHRFHFDDFDQSFLPPVIMACDAVVARYPTFLPFRDLNSREDG